MIVELFGPSGVGKTTLACALTELLRERSCPVELVLSYRPTEHPSSGDLLAKDSARHQITPVVRRLTRPMVEMLATACHLFGNSREASAAAELIRILPPKNMLWSVRLRQYVLRLSHSWQRASLASGVVLFDQAFVQAVCSLAFLARATDDERIGRALDAVPRPDLLIRLEAPQKIFEARLREREHQQGRIERLLEFDLRANLEVARIIDRVHDLVQERGQPVISVNSADQVSLGQALGRIEPEVMAMLSTKKAHRVGGRNLRRGRRPYASAASRSSDDRP